VNFLFDTPLTPAGVAEIAAESNGLRQAGVAPAPSVTTYVSAKSVAEQAKAAEKAAKAAAKAEAKAAKAAAKAEAKAAKAAAKAEAKAAKAAAKAAKLASQN
jgi:hypothetical protein